MFIAYNFEKKRYLQFKLFVRKSNYDYDKSSAGFDHQFLTSVIIVRIYIMSSIIRAHLFLYIPDQNRILMVKVNS